MVSPVAAGLVEGSWEPGPMGHHTTTTATAAFQATSSFQVAAAAFQATSSYQAAASS